MLNTRALLPVWTRTSLKRARLRRAFPDAAYIDSSDVSMRARLGVGAGIAERVVINADVDIGDFTYINRDSIVFSGRIGRYCSIGHCVHIGGEEHPVQFLSTSPFTYGQQSHFNQKAPAFDELSSPPSIGSDVWLGARATVLQGVNIGDGVVVGADSIVTTDLEPYGIYVGSPLRMIRKRFEEATIDRLLSIRWWDMDVSDLRLRNAFRAGAHWQSELFR